MKSIEETVVALTKSESENHLDSETIKGYIIAVQEFKTLVEKGIVEPRGNNSLSIDEVYLKRCSFNASYR